MRSTSDQILMALKSRGEQTAGALAAHLRISPEAVRQHMDRLLRDDLVTYADQAQGVGRPKRLWRLTDKGHGRFPDTHAELSLHLLETVRQEFGEAGLDRLIARREAATLAAYRAEMQDADGLQDRVARLAKIRAREGYMAEWSAEPDGTFLLVENHCPICAAATACQGLCRAELQVFREVLGPDALVERTEYIPHGARRCAYRITPAA